MAELTRLQTARKADETRQLEEAALLAHLAESRGENYDPASAPVQAGFAFSAASLARYIDHNRRLKEARQLARTAPKPSATLQKAA